MHSLLRQHASLDPAPPSRHTATVLLEVRAANGVARDEGIVSDLLLVVLHRVAAAPEGIEGGHKRVAAPNNALGRPAAAEAVLLAQAKQNKNIGGEGVSVVESILRQEALYTNCPLQWGGIERGTHAAAAPRTKVCVVR